MVLNYFYMRGVIGIRISFEFTEDDYINFNLYHVLNSKHQRRIYVLIRYIVPLLMSIPIYIIGAQVLKQNHYLWSVITIAVYVMLILLYPVIYKKSAKRALNKELTPVQKDKIFGHKTVELDDENNIKVISKKKTEQIQFSNIDMIRVNKDMIYLYIDALSALIIPTRDLDELTIKELKGRLGV